MNDIEWRDDMTVGVDKWDSDHRWLVTLIHDIRVAIRQKKDPKDIQAILIALQRYAGVHFAAEENAMRLFDYPDYPAHKLAHDEFRQWIADERDEFLDAPLAWDGEEAVEYLVDWLFSHILTVDKSYEAFFAAKAAGQPDFLAAYKGVGAE